MLVLGLLLPSVVSDSGSAKVRMICNASLSRRTFTPGLAELLAGCVVDPLIVLERERLLIMLGDSMLQILGRDVPEVARCDGEAVLRSRA